MKEHAERVLEEYARLFPRASRQQLKCSLDSYLRNHHCFGMDDIRECKARTMGRYVRCAQVYADELEHFRQRLSAARADEQCLYAYNAIATALELLKVSGIVREAFSHAAKRVLQQWSKEAFFQSHLCSIVVDAYNRILAVDLHINSHLVGEVVNIDIPGIEALHAHMNMAIPERIVQKALQLRSEYEYNMPFYDYLWLSSISTDGR